MQLFLLGRVLAGVRLLTAFAAPTSFAVMTLAALGTLTGQPFESSPASRLETALAGFLIVAVADFCVYWVHRLHHEYPIIWPFHAVHHSAEALTPLTVYRKHPVYDIISRTVRGALTGIAQGLILFAFIGELSALTIGGANAVYVIFNALGANLRHSHIWLDYGPFLGRVFISPAQHQIHHSRAPEHHNRNYGEVLAIWDWMFGTLYLPQRQEALNFGLSAPSGAPLEQPHGTFREAFIGPFVESARAFRAATRGADAVASTPEDPTP
ncbi:MAG: sterol desaturase family protein [Rhodospirillaceae bacterium]|nr:sterol desaturase family protein [Rhodospirillaceae bacterium]